MKQFLAPLLVVCSFVGVSAQAETQEQDDNGSNLMQRGAELFWEGLRKEMAPSLEELEELMATIGPSMQGFLAEMGPALAEIAGKIEDWSVYEAPEILPNGDIIIRRKQPDPAEPDPAEPDTEASPDSATDI